MSIVNSILRFLPASNSTRCILGLALGVIYGTLLPDQIWFLEPVATVFIRLSVVVILPFVVLELVSALGHLSNTSLRAFIRAGSFVILSSIVLGLVGAVYSGSLLPNIQTSGFFTPQVLETSDQINLYDTFFPPNVFRALTEDNFPAIVLVSLAFGLLVQQLPSKDTLLGPIQQIREALHRFNSVIARITPIGIFCIMSRSVASVSFDEWTRMYAFPLVTLSTAIIIGVLSIGLLVSLTPLRLGELLRALRGPLAITATSGSLFIALPLIIESMRELLASRGSIYEHEVDEVADRISASIPIGFALPNMGQVLMLSILPYMGWFMDLPMEFLHRLKVILVSIPASAGGVSVAVRKGIEMFHLPPDVVSIFIVNYEWMTRVDKTLGALSLFSLVAYLTAAHFRVIRVNHMKLATTLVICAALVVAASYLVPRHLTEIMKQSYARNEYLMGLEPIVPEKMSSTITHINDLSDSTLASVPIAAASLDSVKARGYIRVGVFVAGLPWSWMRPDGKLVGYEIDMIQELAQNMNVSIRYYVCPLTIIDSLVLSQRVDVAIGAYPDNTIVNSALNTSRGYQVIHLALLIKDNTHDVLASARKGTLNRPYVLGSYERVSPTSYIRLAVARELSLTSVPTNVEIVEFESDVSYTKAMEEHKIDAIVVSAEFGAAYAILHPEFTMYPSFGKRLPLSVVMLTAGDDRVFEEYFDTWIDNMTRRGFFNHLQKHWIEAENDL